MKARFSPFFLALVFMSTSAFAQGIVTLTRCDEINGETGSQSYENQGPVTSIIFNERGQLVFTTNNDKAILATNLFEIGWVTTVAHDEKNTLRDSKAIKHQIETSLQTYEIVAHSKAENWAVNERDKNGKFVRSYNIKDFLKLALSNYHGEAIANNTNTQVTDRQMSGKTDQFTEMTAEVSSTATTATSL